MIDEEIVKKNLERMMGERAGDMLPLLMTESIGGNAGSWNKLPCAAANFYYNRITGKIKYFGNYQDVPKDIRSRYFEGFFRLAWEFQETRKFFIVEIGVPDYTDEARENLQETAKRFNQEEGFDFLPEFVGFKSGRKKGLKAIIRRSRTIISR